MSRQKSRMSNRSVSKLSNKSKTSNRSKRVISVMHSKRGDSDSAGSSESDQNGKKEKVLFISSPQHNESISQTSHHFFDDGTDPEDACEEQKGHKQNDSLLQSPHVIIDSSTDPQVLSGGTFESDRTHKQLVKLLRKVTKKKDAPEISL